MRCIAWTGLCALAVACGGASSATDRPASASPPSTSSSEPCWPVAAMRVLALDHGSEWEPVAEMQGDGSIYNLSKGRRFVGRVKDDALLDAHDVPTLTCVHREVSSPGAAANMTPARYGSHDEYIDKGVRIDVGDDGAVTLAMGSDARSGAGHIRVEGPIARTRRTAVLLVLTALAGPPQ